MRPGRRQSTSANHKLHPREWRGCAIAITAGAKRPGFLQRAYFFPTACNNAPLLRTDYSDEILY